MKLSKKKIEMCTRHNKAVHLYKKEREAGTKKEAAIAYVCEKCGYSRKQIFNILKRYGVE